MWPDACTLASDAAQKMMGRGRMRHVFWEVFDEFEMFQKMCHSHQGPDPPV